jgi:ribonuclease VapC
MFVDASVLTALLVVEPDSGFFAGFLRGSGAKLTSAMAKWETCVAVSRNLCVTIQDAEREFGGLVDFLSVDIVPITAETGRIALDAHHRYGKGRHAARLNFGDCFAYASAREHGVPLLYKGDDFALTDIKSALD